MKKQNSELIFKFSYVKNGYKQGFFAKKGKATEAAILLGDEKLMYEHITDSVTRDNRLVLALSSNASLGQNMAKNLVENNLILEVLQINSLTLERWIDRISSKKIVDKKRRKLISMGKENLFYAVTCPHCGATIDLSGLNRSSHIYCRFCETIFKEKLGIITQGEKYHPCDECQMFDRVQGYTEFYFYFLLVVYGFYSKRRFLCDTCVDKVFWKMLILNFIFIIGIIPTIWLKIKSLSGRDPNLKQLGKANSLAKKGNYQQASQYYKQCYLKYPQHPGLLMNEGIGHLLGQDNQGAVTIFERSLLSCKNYLPVLNILKNISEASEK